MGIPTLITITGTVRGIVGPVAGRLVFASSTLVRDDSSNDVMVPTEITAIVGADGELNVQIPATDDPGFSPVGWTWEVRPHFPGWKTPFSVAIPYDAPGGELDLSELTPVPPDGTGQLYATFNHTHEGGGGGGDGPDPASTVVSETAYGQAATAGNALTYARGNHTHGTPALPTPAAIGASATGHNHDASYAAATHGHAITDVTNLQTSLDGKSGTSHNHSGVYDPSGTATAAVAVHAGASDPHPQYAIIQYSTGAGYAVANAGTIYVGPEDPGAAADGSIWIDTDA